VTGHIDGSRNRQRGHQAAPDRPEICIRCNTCEATCPVGAITHDDRNYVVRADVCNLCMACISPCPTGSIDNWRTMPKVRAYPIEEQLTWDELPPELTPEQLAAEGVVPEAAAALVAEPVLAAEPEAAAGEAPFSSATYGATVPPWSARTPCTNLFGPKNPATATVAGNVNCTEAGFHNQTHHIVLGLRARCRFRCSKANRSASCRRDSTRTAARTSRASTRWRARGTASGPATTTSRLP
jgi:benzoyl-CoA 2,3-dioxygenase component A